MVRLMQEKLSLLLMVSTIDQCCLHTIKYSVAQG